MLVLGKQKCQAFLAVSPVRKSVGSNPTVVIFLDDTFHSDLDIGIYSYFNFLRDLSSLK